MLASLVSVAVRCGAQAWACRRAFPQVCIVLVGMDSGSIENIVVDVASVVKMTVACNLSTGRQPMSDAAGRAEIEMLAAWCLLVPCRRVE